MVRPALSEWCTSTSDRPPPVSYDHYWARCAALSKMVQRGYITFQGRRAGNLHGVETACGALRQPPNEFDGCRSAPQANNP